MSEIETFRQQLDETERLAKEATPGPWRHNPMKEWRVTKTARGEEFVAAGEIDDPVCVAATGPPSHAQSMADARFIAHADPAWALRWVAAVREILEWHAHTQHRVWGPKYDPDTGELRDAEVDTECEVCGYVDAVCPTVRALMSVYQEEGS